MTTLSGVDLESVEGIGALTLGGFLDEVCVRFAANEALIFEDPLANGAVIRWTYADLGLQAKRVARSLGTIGLGKGARVGVLMGSRPEAVAAIFGAALAGCVAVPISTFSAPPEINYILGHADISVLLTQTRIVRQDFMAAVEALDRNKLGYLTHVVAVGLAEPTSGVQTWADFVAKGQSLPEDRLVAIAGSVVGSDPGLIIYSSGTTTHPKGILHRHQAPALQFWLQARLFGRHESTRMWTALPLFWTAGFNTAMGATLAAGGCWVMQESFDPGDALRLMARHKVTEPYTLPHQTAALEEHPDWLGTDLSSLRCVFGKSAFARHPSVNGDTSWNMPVGYGLSETCAFFAAHPFDTPREVMRHSIGRLLAGNELAVVDPVTGEMLGSDEEGEFCVRGPSLMEGYVKRYRQECFDGEGYFHTGDIGHFDSEGYVFWSGRRSEMIKTGGANVSPAELEVQLRACAPIRLARVVGVPDDRMGQMVVLAVTVKDGREVSEEEIKDFLRARVARYKVPKRVLFFSEGEIPMTGSETKVVDTDLLKLVQDRLGTPSLTVRPGDDNGHS